MLGERKGKGKGLFWLSCGQVLCGPPQQEHTLARPANGSNITEDCGDPHVCKQVHASQHCAGVCTGQMSQVDNTRLELYAFMSRYRQHGYQYLCSCTTRRNSTSCITHHPPIVRLRLTPEQLGEHKYPFQLLQESFSGTSSFEKNILHFEFCPGTI